MWLCTVTLRMNNCKQSIKFKIIPRLPISEAFMLFALLKVETCQEKKKSAGNRLWPGVLPVAPERCGLKSPRAHFLHKAMQFASCRLSTSVGIRSLWNAARKNQQNQQNCTSSCVTKCIWSRVIIWPGLYTNTERGMGDWCSYQETSSRYPLKWAAKVWQRPLRPSKCTFSAESASPYVLPEKQTSGRCMVSLVQERSSAKRHWNSSWRQWLSKALYFWRDWNITQEISVSLAKEIPNALSGRSFCHDVTEDLPETSNYEIFALRNRWHPEQY